MRKEPPVLSDVQLEIMNIVWKRREATVGALWRELSQKRPVSRNTIGTLVQRLEDKGWLRHTKEGNVFRYSAAVPRETTVRSMIGRMVDSVFGGSVEGLVMALIEDRPLSKGEAKRIRAMILDAEKRR